MRYFTRALLHAVRPRDDEVYERVEAMWDSVVSRYHQYMQSIVAFLPHDVARLATVSLHDGIIIEAHSDKHDKYRIVVNGVECPWCDPGYYTIEFVGVSSVEAPDPLVGRQWLYAEVYAAGTDCFEFSVLLDDGELRVTCRDARLSGPT